MDHEHGTWNLEHGTKLAIGKRISGNWINDKGGRQTKDGRKAQDARHRKKDELVANCDHLIQGLRAKGKERKANVGMELE